MEAEPPSSPSSSGPHACVVRPDLELLESVLDHLEISSFRDSRGRLGTRWPCFSLFFTIDDQDDVFSARTIYDHFFGVDDKPELCAVLDEWNRDTTGLKVYTATDDDGSVMIVSEAMMRIDGGVTREQFATSTAIWLGNAGSFHLWLTQRLSLSGLAGEPF